MTFGILGGAVAGLLASALLAALARGQAPGEDQPPSRWRTSASRASFALLTIANLSTIAAGVIALARGEVMVVPVAPAPAVFSPDARLTFGVDALSAPFLVQIGLLSCLASSFGRSTYGRSAIGASWSIFTAALVAVVTARDAISFLVAWELMALAAFFALSRDHRSAEVREGGFLYLVATRVGSLALILLFALMRSVEGHGDFAITHAARWQGANGHALFVLALLGFGLKAGLMPLHVWLPGAHANAPSHVSALMSGVLVNMGVYGLLRLFVGIDHPPVAWGLVLVGLGAVSGVLGVATAIGQHDVKRTLAYSTVENLGIVGLGVGLALLGRSFGAPLLVSLGLGGALLHVFGHGIDKALLFCGAGSVLHATGTRTMDRLGGLARRMPVTSTCFLVGALAISGLPPFNGFVSELMLFLATFRAAQMGRGALEAVAFAGPVLAMIGALSVACFVRVHGVIFLGEPRTGDGRDAHDPGGLAKFAMIVLALLAAAIGCGSVWLVPTLDRAVATFAPELRCPSLAESLPWRPLGLATALLISTTGLVGGLTWWSLRRATVARGPTWDCGWGTPHAQLQYTSSSFGATLVQLFSSVLRPRVRGPWAGQGSEAQTVPFPPRAHFGSEVPDAALDLLVRPLTRGVRTAARRLRWVQQGSINAYVLYIVVTLVACLLWWR